MLESESAEACKMESSVPEGYEVVVLLPESWKDVLLPAAQYYITGEPLCTFLGMTTEDGLDLLEDLIKEWVESGFSVAAKDKNTNEFVGFLFGNIVRENSPLSWFLAQPKRKNAKNYVKVSEVIDTSVNVFEALGVSVGVEHALVAVHPDHRGKGLGLAMAKKLEEMGRNAKCEFSLVSATNISTYKIYSKLGYKEIFELKYNDIELDGKKIYDPSLCNGTKSAINLTKKL